MLTTIPFKELPTEELRNAVSHFQSQMRIFPIGSPVRMKFEGQIRELKKEVNARVRRARENREQQIPPFLALNQMSLHPSQR